MRVRMPLSGSGGSMIPRVLTRSADRSLVGLTGLQRDIRYSGEHRARLMRARLLFSSRTVG